MDHVADMALDPLYNCLLADHLPTPNALTPYLNKACVVYVYPKNNTSGCTRQACELQPLLSDFTGRGLNVVGLSKDSATSHEAFSKAHQLAHPLISDPEGALCQALGVWKEKSMYGKTYWGIERSTFLIDNAGIVRQIWRKVKVPGHWPHVLAAWDRLKSI